MSDPVEHRLTVLESDAKHIVKSLEEIKLDLKPITRHVLTLNGLFKFSTSALAAILIKKLLGY